MKNFHFLVERVYHTLQQGYLKFWMEVQLSFIPIIFIDDIGPIVSELSEYDIDCVAYHGEMDIQSRHTNYSKWRSGETKVMVATSASGMGIDKPDIRNIIWYGVPENICSWAQELGRAGRDGKPSKATVFYSMSDSGHTGAWVKGNINNFEACSRILNDFSIAWKFIMSHLVHKCRRLMYVH